MSLPFIIFAVIVFVIPTLAIILDDKNWDRKPK